MRMTVQEITAREFNDPARPTHARLHMPASTYNEEIEA